jgi:tRNA pseudouridine55 synthase
MVQGREALMQGNEFSGIIVVDKPANITSARVVAIIKKLLGARKVGHTGTLDPFATGVLICCINKATKLARFFLQGWKKYFAVLHLGIETDTQDSTGNIISTRDRINYTEKEIQSVIQQFEGSIEQFPPPYSALKYKGVALYKLARSGKPVQKPARNVFISYINILEIRLPFICFETFCSAGTYIRTLCADIGKSLGCGGHLKELRRTASSGFTLKEAVTLPELEKLSLAGRVTDRLISMTNALPDIPEHIADQVLTEKIKQGRSIIKNDIRSRQTDNTERYVKIVDKNRNLIAVVQPLKESPRYKYIVSFIE